MKRSLYASRPNPYYILAPDFRRNSAGIRVLHMLCDALIRSGYEAYITSEGVNPALMTPPLTPALVKAHKTHGIEPIMVYPEVVDGNPYDADVVVRYLLNSPGAVGGKGVYDDRDMLFSFTQGLVQPGMPEDNVLFLQPVDLSVFRLPEDPGKRIPGKVCFYQGRSGSGIDESILPEGSIRITTGYPTTWEGLVDIFQTCEFFYSATTSALAAEAALCGCIGVVIPGVEAPLDFSCRETGSHGVAWGTSVEEIDRARASLPLLRASLEHQSELFWPALDHFIRITQEAAAGVIRLKAVSNVTQRLNERLPSPAQVALIEERLQSGAAPSIAVFIVDAEFDPTGQRMGKTMRSVNEQPRHGLTLDVRVVSARGFSQLGVPVVHFDGTNLAGVLNRAIADSSAGWFVILRAGDELTVNGFTAAAVDLIDAQGHRAIYSDLVMRQGDGSLGMLLRPNLNIDLLLSLPVTMTSHWLLRRDTWLQSGAFNERFAQAFEFDYLLRVIEEHGFSGIGHVSEPLVISELSSFSDSDEERAAIERHLHARGFESARAVRSEHGGNDLDYGHWQRPKVSIMIPVIKDLMQMKLCLALLLENAGYEDYEILFLDQGHTSPDIVQWLSDVNQVSEELMRVVQFAADVSLEQACNAGVDQARGEYVVFLDARISVLGRDWLHQLLNHALRPEVGVVGPKLVKPDGTVYSAGLHLGLNGVAGTPFADLPGDDPGFLLRLHVDQNYSALSRECLMVRREVFMAVGGFDEVPELAPWAHVDLCLKIQQAGFLGVWVARAKMLAPDEKAQQPCPDADAALYTRWLPVIAHDPVQSPSVSLRGKGFEADVEFARSWQPSNIRPVPVVLAISPPAGTPGLIQVAQRFDSLKADGVIDGAVSLSRPTLPEIYRYSPDVVVLQYPLSPSALIWLNHIKHQTQMFTVLEVNRLGPVSGDDQPNGLDPLTLDALQQSFDRVDRVVVSTPLLAESLMGMHRDIRIQPPRLSPDVWGHLQGLRGRDSKPRVGYVSERGHDADLALIVDAVRALADKVNWVFLGECPEALRRYVHEVHAAPRGDAYPRTLASLDLDLAVVPAADHVAQRYASNARLLEFGACAVPVICSDIESFAGDLPVTIVRAPEAWTSVIDTCLTDPAANALQGDALRAAVLQDGLLTGDALQSLARDWLPD